jgi:hypothetical protein
MIMWKAVKKGWGCRGAGDYNLNIHKTPDKAYHKISNTVS